MIYLEICSRFLTLEQIYRTMKNYALLLAVLITHADGSSVIETHYKFCSYCKDIVTLLESTVRAKSSFKIIRPVAIQYCEDILDKLQYDGKTQCPGLVDLYGPVVQKVLVEFSEQRVSPCVHLNLCPDVEAEFPVQSHPKSNNACNMNFQEYERNRLYEDTQQTKVLRVLQISDIHIDPLYEEGSAIDCGLFLCCRKNNTGTGDAGHYGSYGCDTPERTMNIVLHNIKKLRPKPDFVIYTGDSPPHDIWDQTVKDQLRWDRHVVQALSKALDGTPVFPTLGNHETFPQNLYNPKGHSYKNFNHKLATMWRRLFPESISQWRSIRSGAYYTHRVRPGLHIISINTQFWYTLNFYTLTLQKKRAYKKHLRFIIKYLNKAKRKKEKVILIGHIPPGDVGSANLAYGDFYKYISKNFNDVIVLQAFGHTHFDQFEVVNALDDVTATVFIAPAVTTYSGNNPSFRMYLLNRSDYQLIDYVQYYMNLTAANDFGDTEMKRLYSARTEYGLVDMSPMAFYNLSQRLLCDDALFEKYMHNKYVGNPRVPSCNALCRILTICKIRSASLRSYIHCILGGLGPQPLQSAT